VDIISNSNVKYTVDIIMVGFKGYKTNKGEIPKYTDYNGMIEFSKALRKYYEVSTPKNRAESYKPWLSDNVIDTTGPWYKGHRKLRKEDNIVKDVVYVLAKTLHEEVNKNHMNKKIKSIDSIYKRTPAERYYEQGPTGPVLMPMPTDENELKIEKRMQVSAIFFGLSLAVTAVFGCILLYAILYKL
jgi:hypothetical protein